MPSYLGLEGLLVPVLLSPRALRPGLGFVVERGVPDRGSEMARDGGEQIYFISGKSVDLFSDHADMRDALIVLKDRDKHSAMKTCIRQHPCVGGVHLAVIGNNDRALFFIYLMSDI